MKHRKTPSQANGHLPNELVSQDVLPPEYAFAAAPHEDFKQHHQLNPAHVTHRDPEITKIIKKPNRHFRLYVVSE